MDNFPTVLFIIGITYSNAMVDIVCKRTTANRAFTQSQFENMFTELENRLKIMRDNCNVQLYRRESNTLAASLQHYPGWAGIAKPELKYYLLGLHVRGKKEHFRSPVSRVSHVRIGKMLGCCNKQCMWSPVTVLAGHTCILKDASKMNRNQMCINCILCYIIIIILYYVLITNFFQ